MKDQEPSIRAFRKRLLKTKEQLENHQEGKSQIPIKAKTQAVSQGMDMVIQMVASFFVGGLIGYGFDVLLGTRPLLCIIFCFFGIIAGVITVFRSAQRKSQR